MHLKTLKRAAPTGIGATALAPHLGLRVRCSRSRLWQAFCASRVSGAQATKGQGVRVAVVSGGAANPRACPHGMLPVDVVLLKGVTAVCAWA